MRPPPLRRPPYCGASITGVLVSPAVTQDWRLSGRHCAAARPPARPRLSSRLGARSGQSTPKPSQLKTAHGSPGRTIVDTSQGTFFLFSPRVFHENFVVALILAEHILIVTTSCGRPDWLSFRSPPRVSGPRDLAPPGCRPRAAPPPCTARRKRSLSILELGARWASRPPLQLHPLRPGQR